MLEEEKAKAKDDRLKVINQSEKQSDTVHVTVSVRDASLKNHEDCVEPGKAVDEEVLKKKREKTKAKIAEFHRIKEEKKARKAAEMKEEEEAKQREMKEQVKKYIEKKKLKAKSVSSTLAKVQTLGEEIEVEVEDPTIPSASSQSSHMGLSPRTKRIVNSHLHEKRQHQETSVTGKQSPKSVPLELPAITSVKVLVAAPSTAAPSQQIM